MHLSTQTSNLIYICITLPSSPSFLDPLERIQDEKKIKGEGRRKGEKTKIKNRP
jgi:hypothetical protein